MQFSIFGGITDKVPQSMTVRDFDELIEMLMEVAQPIAVKKTHGLFSPATYIPGKGRGLANVQGCELMVFDSDEAGVRIQDVVGRMSGLRGVLHTSYSHRNHHHKFRLIVPLSRCVDAVEYKALWKGLNNQMGLNFDSSQSHAAAMFFLPSYPVNTSPTQFVSYEGDVLPVDQVLEMIEQEKPIAAPAKAAKKRTCKASWNGLFDCPYVNQKILNSYLCLPHGGKGHYNTMFKFAVALIKRAKEHGQDITLEQVADLLIELDNLDDSHHQQNGRDLTKWAANAFKYA